MTHLEQELYSLKVDTSVMMNMVLSQFEKAESALINFDKEIIKDIKHLEKKVDAYELKISMDCENTLALFSPVAVDLRFVLAVLKMVTSVERLGDYAKSLGSTIGKLNRPVNQDLLDSCQVLKMFDIAKAMLKHVQSAFENDNSVEARVPLKLDDDLDAINELSDQLIIEWIRQNPDDVDNALRVLLIIKRLERFGDQVKNIAHEIIFHHEAKMFKHHKKQLKKEMESVIISDKDNVE